MAKGAGSSPSIPASEDRGTAPATQSLRQFVVKVHSRCDLACDHCYIYEHADSSWRGRPSVIPLPVVVRTAERIAEHAAAHELDTVHVVLHGGEPLLAGPARLRAIAEEFRSALSGHCRLDLRLQTNAVRLDERFCELFLEHDIKVGVSLDGDRSAHDRHRRFRDGRGSHHHVLRGVRLLNEPRHRHLFAGLLCTVDTRNDPLQVYSALLAAAPPRVDFLLPHATWDQPPARHDGRPTPYADWLIAIADEWFATGRPVPVRLFESILSLLAGGPSFVESTGTTSVDHVVIETDGTIEQADSLKTAYEGAPQTGMDVFSHSLDDVSDHPGLRERRRGLSDLCATCRSCPLVQVCGGGLYAHRFRSGHGFDNPSVYCRDLTELITHFQQRFRD
ncbi:FxsB family cyclophane-forming radical SAM/SPASM peptide maturase [Streptomyces sp. NPDC000345]|uniref:FxsB family cyclophane-forming radical SAM/SPASM peptide maturase n=1 Tax=Streptomyces sp. NPDC000345 TaxID=3364537 RepID=UPI0036C36BA0